MLFGLSDPQSRPWQTKPKSLGWGCVWGRHRRGLAKSFFSASQGPKDIFKTKNRLVELGFLNGPVDHVSWDKKSRMALRRFKTAEGLTGDDVWDEKVGGLLFSTNAIRAPMPLARRLR